MDANDSVRAFAGLGLRLDRELTRSICASLPAEWIGKAGLDPDMEALVERFHGLFASARALIGSGLTKLRDGRLDSPEEAARKKRAVRDAFVRKFRESKLRAEGGADGRNADGHQPDGQGVAEKG